MSLTSILGLASNVPGRVNRKRRREEEKEWMTRIKGVFDTHLLVHSGYSRDTLQFEDGLGLRIQEVQALLDEFLAVSPNEVFRLFTSDHKITMESLSCMDPLIQASRDATTKNPARTIKQSIFNTKHFGADHHQQLMCDMTQLITSSFACYRNPMVFLDGAWIRLTVTLDFVLSNELQAFVKFINQKTVKSYGLVQGSELTVTPGNTKRSTYSTEEKEGLQLTLILPFVG